MALIRDGYIVDIADMNAIRNRPVKEFKVEFKNHDDFVKFGGLGYEIIRVQEQYNQYTVKIKSEDGGKLISSLVGYDVKFISELPYTLERHFKEILKEKESKKDVQ